MEQRLQSPYLNSKRVVTAATKDALHAIPPEQFQHSFQQLYQWWQKYMTVAESR
jgi:hypothetical protein